MATSPVSLDPAMERLHAEIALLRDRLAASSRALEQTSVARLLSETPLADDAYRVARDAHLRLGRRLRLVEAALGSMILEQEDLGQGLQAG